MKIGQLPLVVWRAALKTGRTKCMTSYCSTASSAVRTYREMGSWTLAVLYSHSSTTSSRTLVLFCATIINSTMDCDGARN